MDARFIQRIAKIEARLAEALPENPGALWIAKTFPDLDGPWFPACTGPLLEPGRDILARGGKRWRPLLMTLICERLGGGDAALPLTPLIELPHNASLIHDDIEDNADERRGKPAVHLIHGVDSAINGGSFLYFLPLSCIDGWDAPGEWKNRVYACWGEQLRRLHLGQAMDIHWHRHRAALPGLEEYTLMCRLKTGSLARLAAHLGVYAAYARFPVNQAASCEQALRVWGEAAEKLGVGFQILDDVKNLTTGNPGKKRGDDLVEGKKSLPILLFLRKNPGGRPLVERCFAAARSGGAGVPEVEELIQALESQDILTEARSWGDALVDEAQRSFASYGGGRDEPERSAEAQTLLGGIAGLLR
ncbi:MAG: polyprenyl synthetase family protein [Treponema sp.]|jgi:octaprenyl-diphosphate synthase|nr:polyprenyl synthetase family protein [Treponema sp.]